MIKPAPDCASAPLAFIFKKKLFYSALFAGVLLLFSCRAALAIPPVLKESEIEMPHSTVSAKGPEVTVQKNQKGGFYAAKFTFTGRVEVKSFYLSNPHRFVVDFIGAALTDGQKLLALGTADVTAIRLAQFSAGPDIVRAVFDMEKPEKFLVKQDESGAVVVVMQTGEAAPAYSAIPFPKPAVIKLADRIVVKMRFREAPKFEKATAENENEFALDFPGYKPAEALEEISVGAGLFKLVRVAHYEKKQDVTRVTLVTKLPARITVDKEDGGRTVVVTAYQPSLYGAKITVDPGHGGIDPGAMSGSGLVEREIVLDISMKLKKLLESAGAVVTMTREKDDFVSLDDRAFIANKSGSELFLSVHANALPDHSRKLSCRGLQMLYWSKDSEEYARVMLGELLDTLGTGDQGLSVRRLVVLRKTRMKAVLAEMGFVTHPNDGELFRSDVFRENAARGLFNGLERFKGGRGVKLAALPLPPEMQAQMPGGVIVNKYLASGKLPDAAGSVHDIAAPGLDGSNEDGIYVVPQGNGADTDDNPGEEGVIRPTNGGIRKGSPTNLSNPKLEHQK
jgi:N-acetylmuramoyl-L-alanine amidase